MNEVLANQFTSLRYIFKLAIADNNIRDKREKKRDYVDNNNNQYLVKYRSRKNSGHDFGKQNGLNEWMITLFIHG